MVCPGSSLHLQRKVYSPKCAFRRRSLPVAVPTSPKLSIIWGNEDVWSRKGLANRGSVSNLGTAQNGPLSETTLKKGTLHKKEATPGASSCPLTLVEMGNPVFRASETSEVKKVTKEETGNGRH